MNSSGLNQKEFSQLAGQQRAVRHGSCADAGQSDFTAVPDRIPDRTKSRPQQSSHAVVAVDGLGLPRPQIAYDISDYTEQGFVAAVRMRKVIFRKLGLPISPRVASQMIPLHSNAIDGKTELLTYGGAGHVMGTYRMGSDPEDIRRRLSGSAPMITRTYIWSEAEHFRRWALPIRRSRCLRWHCGPQSTSSKRPHFAANVMASVQHGRAPIAMR